MNFQHLSDNLMARNKVLYDDHAVAAVAAATLLIAKQAVKLIEVEYEVLPHVIDARRAGCAGSADAVYGRDRPKPTTPSNIASRVAFAIGDIDAGFQDADEIVEREYRKPVHQVIQPSACIANVSSGTATVWSSSQGNS